MKIVDLKRLLEVMDRGCLYFAGDKSAFDLLVQLRYVDIAGNRITATDKATRLLPELEKFLEIYH